MKPSTSFVMPMYNGVRTVERAMDSVRAQTVSDWELLVVDDCSKDGSREVVSNYIARTGDTRIRLIERESNGGPGPGRNTGVDLAAGHFITFLDCDDEVVPNYLATLLPLMDVDGVDVAVAAHIACTPKGRRINRPDSVTGLMSGLDAVNAIMQDRMWNFNHGKLYRRELFEHVRSRDETIRYEDLVFNCAAFSYSRKVNVSPTPVHIYYIASSSVTWSQELSLWFIEGSMKFLKDGLNPAIRDQVAEKSWVTLRATLDIVTLSGAYATGASTEITKALQAHLRSDVSFADTLKVSTVAPRIAISILFAKILPQAYATVYRRYVRRNYNLEA